MSKNLINETICKYAHVPMKMQIMWI
jgi:hypothetical protein